MFLNCYTRSPDLRENTIVYSAQYEADVGNLADTNAVATWNDIESGGETAFNATQGTAAQRPTFALAGNGDGSITFDGADSLQISAIPLTITDFYAVCAFKISSLPSALEYIMHFKNGTTSGMDLRIRADNKLAAYTYNGATREVWVQSTAMSTDKVYVFSLMADASGAKVYLDGEFQGSHAFAYVHNGAVANFIGAADATGTTGFTGTMYSACFMAKNTGGSNMPGPAWRRQFERHLINTRRMRVTAS